MFQSLLATFYAGIYTFLSGASSYHLVIEAVLVICIIWLLFRKSYKPAAKFELSEKIKDELIAEWKPEPLVPEVPQDHYALNPKYVEGKMGKYIRIDGVDYLNLATMNFLGFVGDKRIEETAKKTIFKYGVGSCGPRGFYGTVDVHLDLEKEISDFMGCEETVLYSYGFATIASAIPAYAKKGDIIFCDKAANFAIQKGLQASRSRVEWFEHNDMNDIERLLMVQAEKDKQNPKKAKVIRRFLVVEGIYLNTGSICPLKRLVEFKWKYKVRIFIDESISFGILGKNGRGVTEHFGVPMNEVDMIMASLEYGMASTGGFCCGRTYVVDHQRLSGVGYCFSASLPPLLATAAGEALKILQAEPGRLERLSGITKKFKTDLSEKCFGTNFTLEGSEMSPVFHLRYQHEKAEKASEVLDRVVETVFNESVALTRARHLDHEEAFIPQPSIRIALNSELTNEELDKAISALAAAVESVEKTMD